MEARLQKWGNSDGIRIPSNILKALNLKTNDTINLEQVEDKIVISKKAKSKMSLAEKFREYHGENLAKEFSWDNKKGKEIW